VPSPLRDSLDDIQEYYRDSNEQQRFHRQQLEFFVTLQVLNYYLRPPLRILELGSGAGTYTIPLATVGHQVTAYDFSKELSEFSRGAVKDAGLSEKVEHVVADARDVAKVLGGREYDAILIMGPLYHLIREAERKRVLEQSAQLTRIGGSVVTAHMTRAGFLGFALMRHPEAILGQRAQLEEVWKTGFVKKHPRNGHFRCYCSTIEEAVSLHQGCGLTFVACHAQDPLLMANEIQFNTLPDPLKRGWVEFLYSLSAFPEMVATSRHFLCISLKGSAP